MRDELAEARINSPAGQTITTEIHTRRLIKANNFAQRAAQARREREAQGNEND